MANLHGSENEVPKITADGHVPSVPGKKLLLLNCSIVTMNPELQLYRKGALLVENDKITAIGPSHVLANDPSLKSAERVDLTGKWLLPGLVNTHVHTSQQLGRGIADEVDLVTWLHDRIWPYEAALTENDSYLSTLLCGVELIRSGVTCFAEAGGQHVPGMARAVTELGLRACLCPSIMDSGEGLPAKWAAATADSCIQEQEALHAKFNGTAEGRIRSWFGLRQILNSTDALLRQTKEAADRLQTGIHMHVAEIPFENEHVAATRGLPPGGGGTVTHLNNIGVLGANLLAAHSVWISEPEVDMFAAARVNSCHCPGSAMHMLGFSPVEEMLKKGVNVSLGTDGAPSNNRMSLVDEMYLAGLINKGKKAFTDGVVDPTALPAETVLQMATINGARTCLWDSEIGSLEVGKKADLVVVNPHSFTMLPLHDPIANLVYSMRTENIESVMCNGKWLMRDKRILTVDETWVLKAATEAAAEVVTRAKIVLPKRNYVD
eukprot:TRINITY_DN36068_c0_g1_i1.p1 TRINITY_DN36068_c0_g1~~TRINITY_DN36068_c0_g1_i1.p1  ORF type:complete len:492 (+),score=65.94 TRINITY_DN36068_c0_g1_i1:216-1691(+)